MQPFTEVVSADDERFLAREGRNSNLLGDPTLGNLRPKVKMKVAKGC